MSNYFIDEEMSRISLEYIKTITDEEVVAKYQTISSLYPPQNIITPTKRDTKYEDMDYQGLNYLFLGSTSIGGEEKLYAYIALKYLLLSDIEVHPVISNEMLIKKIDIYRKGIVIEPIGSDNVEAPVSESKDDKDPWGN